ncbi:MAG: hypothetical protein WAL22_22400 [Solirubrobacteraceae bacterium]
MQPSVPPPPPAELCSPDPQLGHALLDLEPRLGRAAQVAIWGMRALP